MPSLHPALLGALIGLALAAFFVFSEYALLSKAVAERAKRQGRKQGEFSAIERERMKSIVRFAIFLPPGIALACWIVLPRLGL